MSEKKKVLNIVFGHKLNILFSNSFISIQILRSNKYNSNLRKKNFSRIML
jgi:hypothetical protein